MATRTAQTNSRHADSWPLKKTGLAALSVGLGLGAAGDSGAAVIYTDIPDVVLSGPVDTFHDLDVDNDGVVDFTLFRLEFAGDRAAGAYGFNGYVAINLNGYYPYARALTGGARVSADLPFDYYGVMAVFLQPSSVLGEWGGLSNRYLGLSFFDANGDEHFAWARLSVDATTLQTTLFDYAYESTPGVAICAGAPNVQCVPEPASILLLATGALGLLAHRRRRREALPQAA